MTENAVHGVALIFVVRIGSLGCVSVELVIVLPYHLRWLSPVQVQLTGRVGAPYLFVLYVHYKSIFIWVDLRQLEGLSVDGTVVFSSGRQLVQVRPHPRNETVGVKVEVVVCAFELLIYFVDRLVLWQNGCRLVVGLWVVVSP